MNEDKRVPCSGCSLLCDDIIVIEKDKSNYDIIGACLKGIQKFEQRNSKNRILSPYIRQNNELVKVEWDEAIKKTIKLIKGSLNPILYGFSTTSCETQLKAIKLAQKINGFIDSNSTICQGKVLNSAKKKGITTITLTEIINKSDVIILWGFNAVESIPRLLSKVLFSRGKFRLTGREIKTLIIIDTYKNASFKVLGTKDLALIVEPDKDIDLIKILKKICKNNIKLPNEGTAGIDKEDIKRFITYLLNSENIVIFIGQGLLKIQKDGNPLEKLLDLIDIINNKNKNGRISTVMMGGHYNMAGFEHIALSYIGKNQNIQFQNRKLIQTKMNIISKIKERDFDLSIIVGTDAISHFPSEISKILTSRPIILIDNRKSGTYFVADIVLPTAITGIESEGLAFRFDHVPIKLKKIMNPPNDIPNDEELLDKIISKLDKNNVNSD